MKKIILLFVVLLISIAFVNAISISQVKINPSETLQGGSVDLCLDVVENNPNAYVDVIFPDERVRNYELIEQDTPNCFTAVTGVEMFYRLTDTQQIGNYTLAFSADKGGDTVYINDSFKTVPLSVVVDYVSNVGSVDTCKTVEELKEPSIDIFGTEYEPLQLYKTFLQYLDSEYQPIQNTSCYSQIYNPDNTIYASYSLMNYVDEGLYENNGITPNTTGVYMVSAYCQTPSPISNITNTSYITENWEGTVDLTKFVYVSSGFDYLGSVVANDGNISPSLTIDNFDKRFRINFSDTIFNGSVVTYNASFNTDNEMAFKNEDDDVTYASVITNTTYETVTVILGNIGTEGIKSFVVYDVGAGNNKAEWEYFSVSSGFGGGTGWTDSMWQDVNSSCNIITTSNPRDTKHLEFGGCEIYRTFNNTNCTTGYMTFWAKANSLEGGDQCIYYYYNGTSYISTLTLTDGDDDDTYRYYSYEVCNTYGANTNARMKVEGSTADADYCYVDDINILWYTENEINITDVYQFVRGSGEMHITDNTQTIIDAQINATEVWNYYNRTLTNVTNIAGDIWGYQGNVTNTNIVQTIVNQVWDYVARYIHGEII